MIVDHSCRLHMSIDDRAADEFESALLQVLAQCIRFGGCGRHVGHRAHAILLRLATDELPDVVAKTVVFFLHLQKTLRVDYGAAHLELVSDDARLK